MEAKNQLNYIFSDMDVHDVNGNRIGTVKYVYYGSETPVGNLPEDDATKRQLVEAMGGDKNFPVPILTRLYHHGFIRVGRWFFQPDLFILPEQILAVEGQNVRLNCRISELLRG